jgi:hypothetical protein
MTVVQGNPASAVARSGVVFSNDVLLREFALRLKPLARDISVAEKASKDRAAS